MMDIENEEESTENPLFLLDCIIQDCVSNFLYYDRKEDFDMPVGKIESLIKNGDLSEQEIIDLFAEHLLDGLEKK